MIHGRTMRLVPGITGVGVLLDHPALEQLERVVSLQRLVNPRLNDGQIVDAIFRIGMAASETIAAATTLSDTEH